MGNWPFLWGGSSSTAFHPLLSRAPFSMFYFSPFLAFRSVFHCVRGPHVCKSSLETCFCCLHSWVSIKISNCSTFARSHSRKPDKNSARIVQAHPAQKLRTISACFLMPPDMFHIQTFSWDLSGLPRTQVLQSFLRHAGESAQNLPRNRQIMIASLP